MDIFELCEQIDAMLIDGLHENSYLYKMYQFFDSAEWKPLTPREFYEFLGSLRAEEYQYYMHALD